MRNRFFFGILKKHWKNKVIIKDTIMEMKDTETKQTSEETVSTQDKVVSEGVEKNIMKGALLISGAVLLGSLIISGALLTFAPVGGKTVTADTANTPPAAPAEADVNVAVSMDDDAVLGDKNKAKVAIVEFTDFECPFCKRFHTETFDDLVKNYVNTGKVVVVTRDFPLSFHDPKATEEAALAECVRKEKGDNAYFSFAKSLYQNTIANGKGLPEGKMDELVRAVGANIKTVTACAATDAVKQEIAKDIADGGKVGINGTPSFVIGTIGKDGLVTGERVVGALPLTGANSLSTTLEKYLAQ